MVRDTDLKKATAIEAYSKAYTSLK
jgi:hypothetical protein